MSYLDCYHYFHSNCLKTHFVYSQKLIAKEKSEAIENKLKWIDRKVSCPVCREPLKGADIECLKKLNVVNVPVSTSNDNFFGSEKVVISEKIRKMQRDMNALFEKQKLAGGIIDNTEPEIIVLNVSFFFLFF